MTELTFDIDRLATDLLCSKLQPWSKLLGQSVLAQEHALKHGLLPKWEAAVAALPPLADATLSIDDGVVSINAAADCETTQQLRDALLDLIPWRKGPFKFASQLIDTEWRSDWKWDRIESHLAPLDGRVVLDVGCGNGYHLWRMRKAGARQVLGIDPSLLYLMQFNAVQQYANDSAVQFLPLKMEALPPKMAVFDTLFSMGVLYHRRDPVGHLIQLQEAMKPGGQLVLETLIVPGNENSTLRLNSRYANMRNVYELPTMTRLQNWMRDAGFSAMRTVSVNTTSRSEQRSTDWMPSHSLADALDPNDSSRTIEGHPRPLRAVVLAEWPG